VQLEWLDDRLDLLHGWSLPREKSPSQNALTHHESRKAVNSRKVKSGPGCMTKSPAAQGPGRLVTKLS
ncbi:MAG: hypothetical protein ACOVOC_18085, partial [Rhabdaerophilum sp.]